LSVELKTAQHVSDSMVVRFYGYAAPHSHRPPYAKSAGPKSSDYLNATVAGVIQPNRETDRLSQISGSCEGVFDTHTCDRLSRVQVFREDPIGTTFESSRDNERIPESDLGFILDFECS